MITPWAEAAGTATQAQPAAQASATSSGTFGNWTTGASAGHPRCPRDHASLSVAAIITSAVSLLIFGLTLLMQQGFDNLLTAWEGGVEMIVYVNPGASDAQRAEIESALRGSPQQIETFRYCNPDCSMEEARRQFLS